MPAANRPFVSNSGARRGDFQTRRAFIAGLAVAGNVTAIPKPVGLSFGTYALWMLRWEDSLELIARTGYDGVEIALMPDWPTTPKRLSGGDRRRMRGMLADLGLALPAFLDNLQLVHPVQTHAENVERLRRAIDLGNEVVPGKPPIFETVLGRKPDEWEAVKRQMVDEIGELTRVAADGETVICFKPHVSNAVNNVERSLWLVRQVGSRYFRCTYDFSHLWLAGHELAPSLKALIPVSPYIHLKDARRTADKHEFLLPGDGPTDYVEMFGELGRLGYDGFACIEVSAQIHKLPDFQPIAIANLCYERMVAAFEEAGLPRPEA